MFPIPPRSSGGCICGLPKLAPSPKREAAAEEIAAGSAVIDMPPVTEELAEVAIGPFGR